MLFPYKFVPHQMDKMQAFIDFIFLEVWCQAPLLGVYDLKHFDAHPELKQVMETCHYSDAQYANFFAGHIQQIYEFFAQLDPSILSQLKIWYQNNNNIEQICANNPSVNIAQYSCLCDLLAHKALLDKITTFFKGLYEKRLLTLKAIKDKIGTIDEHYKAFRIENKIAKCPFCGIHDMKTGNHHYRDAYDHYLPKGQYPFNTINFHNLVPTCHECNSTYKLQKDPCHGATGRRKIFYPYSSNTYNIELTIKLTSKNWRNIQPNDIELTFGPSTLNEEIETWKEVYGIEERYKAKCCAEEDGKEWLVQLYDEWQGKGGDTQSFMDSLTKVTSRSPYTDNNFLKKPFFEECLRAKLFD